MYRLARIEPARVVVFIDEIEKAFAGAGTDLSGVKADMTRTMLPWMQDRDANGCIFIGPPGEAKSTVAKATGNAAGIPTISFDLGAMQSSLVGASGDRLRTTLKVVDAVSRAALLFIATCNSITSSPPESRRIFTVGTVFFDLPPAEERAVIWKIHTKKCDALRRISRGRRLDRSRDQNLQSLGEPFENEPVLRLALYRSGLEVSSRGQEKTQNQASGKFISGSKAGLNAYSKGTA